MPGIQSLINSLATGLSELTAGQTVSGLTDKAKTTWNAQTPGTKGAIAGGLVGLLLSGNARRMAGSVVQVGAAALIGRLAMQAYSDWQSQASEAPAAEDLPHRLLQAMIAAAKADDVVTAEERAAVEAELANLGLGAEAEALIRAELDAPLDAEAVAALARTPQEAAALYTASLLIIDQRGQAEHSYLQTLAARLGLDAALVRHLEANVPVQA
jgi:uncharacterized membrane protein YebE (DUF533 family)